MPFHTQKSVNRWPYLLRSSPSGPYAISRTTAKLDYNIGWVKWITTSEEMAKCTVSVITAVTTFFLRPPPPSPLISGSKWPPPPPYLKFWIRHCIFRSILPSCIVHKKPINLRRAWIHWGCIDRACMVPLSSPNRALTSLFQTIIDTSSEKKATVLKRERMYNNSLG